MRIAIIAWFAVVIAGWIVARFTTDVGTIPLTVIGIVLLAPAQIVWNRTGRQVPASPHS